MLSLSFRLVDVALFDEGLDLGQTEEERLEESAGTHDHGRGSVGGERENCGRREGFENTQRLQGGKQGWLMRTDKFEGKVARDQFYLLHLRKPPDIRVKRKCSGESLKHHVNEC